MKQAIQYRIPSLLLCLCLLFCWGQLFCTEVFAAVDAGVSPQIAIGNDYMLALDSGGKIYAWGLNDSGVLGNGTEVSSATPVEVTMPQSVTFVAISAGYNHAMALSSDGEVYTWGSDNNGQLGNGDTSSANVTVPTKITVDVTKKAVAIAAGYSFSLALLSDGSVYAWGLNDKGQLGTEKSMTPTTTPTVIAGLQVTAIAAGENNAAAIGHDGLIWSWGGNAGGQTDAMSTSPQLPTQYVANTTYFAKQVAISNTHVSITTLAGQVLGKGSYANGCLGTGETKNETAKSFKTATFAEGILIGQIAAGGSHMLALDSNGALYTWGKNASGQLGNGNTTDTNLPAQVTPALESGDKIVAIAAGIDNTAVIDSSGFIWTWGDNTGGALGTGRTDFAQSTTPTSVLKANGDRFSLGTAPMISIYNASVTATVSIPSPIYNVTIPATLEVGELRQRATTDATRYSTTPFTVSVSDVDNLFGEKEIVVTLNTDSGSFELKDGDHTLPYEAYATESGGEALATGADFATFTSDGSVTGRIVVDQSLITRKGSYSGTLIFSFAVEPKSDAN